MRRSPRRKNHTALGTPGRRLTLLILSLDSSADLSGLAVLVEMYILTSVSTNIHHFGVFVVRPKRRDCHPRRRHPLVSTPCDFGRSGFPPNVIEPWLVGHQSTFWLSA